MQPVDCARTKRYTQEPMSVARDGRDTAMSLHNQWITFNDQARQRFDRIGLSDPAIGHPFPAIPTEPVD